jgi:hypothetical protein
MKILIGKRDRVVKCVRKIRLIIWEKLEGNHEMDDYWEHRRQWIGFCEPTLGGTLQKILELPMNVCCLQPRTLWLPLKWTAEACWEYEMGLWFSRKPLIQSCTEIQTQRDEYIEKKTLVNAEGWGMVLVLYIYIKPLGWDPDGYDVGSELVHAYGYSIFKSKYPCMLLNA